MNFEAATIEDAGPVGSCLAALPGASYREATETNPPTGPDPRETYRAAVAAIPERFTGVPEGYVVERLSWDEFRATGFDENVPDRWRSGRTGSRPPARSTPLAASIFASTRPATFPDPQTRPKRLRGVHSLDWPCGQNTGRKPEGHQRALAREAMSLGEQSSARRASTLYEICGTLLQPWMKRPYAG